MELARTLGKPVFVSHSLTITRWSRSPFILPISGKSLCRPIHGFPFCQGCADLADTLDEAGCDNRNVLNYAADRAADR